VELEDCEGPGPSVVSIGTEEGGVHSFGKTLFLALNL